MTDLGDFKRIVHEPLEKALRRKQSVVRHAQHEYALCQKFSRDPIDQNFIAIPRDCWEALGAALEGTASTTQPEVAPKSSPVPVSASSVEARTESA